MAVELSKESQSGLLALIHQYWHIVLKWKWTVLLFLCVSLSVLTLYSFLVPPVFTASGTVWIEDEAKVLPFEDVQSFGADTNLQSQARLLQSRTLAANTIDRLKLYENPDFAGKPKKGEKAQDPTDPVFRERLIRQFLKEVSVESVERTRLVYVRFSNRNPALAAEVLNSLFDGFIDMIVSMRYSASEKASEFLKAQISELRTDIEQKEKELNQYGSERDILPLTAAEAPTVSRIAGINKSLTEATIDKINKLNYYSQLKAAPLGEIPNAPDGSLIQRLREQYVNLSRQYSTRLATVRPEYPEMQRLKSDLDSAKQALETETQNLIRNAYNEYQGALRQELSLQRLLDDQKNAAYKANSNSINYNSLRIALENKKTLLESLSKRQSETDVSSRLRGLEALNVWIVDKADFPLKPAFPSKRKNVFFGFVFGLAGGIGLALGLEYLNHTVKSSRDISNTIGISTLGSVPAFDAEARAKGPRAELIKIISMFLGQREKRETSPHRKKHTRESRLAGLHGLSEESRDTKNRVNDIELIVMHEPNSIQAESYRSIRTTLLVSSPPGRMKTIIFTSPLAREGKSSTVSNLGITLAEAGKRVVIVDADLRKPKQSRIFGTSSSSSPGLSRYLSSNLEAAELPKPTSIPNLYLIASGPLPANPIELLASERMDSLVAFLRRTFDFILFDAPPLLAVSDALAMGPMADAIILIARGGQTPIPAMKQAKQKLDAHKLKCLGVILNGVDLVEQDGYYAREYYSYSKTA